MGDPFLLQLCDDVGERFYVVEDRAGTALTRRLTHNAHRANARRLLDHAGADIKCDVGEAVLGSGNKQFNMSISPMQRSMKDEKSVALTAVAETIMIFSLGSMRSRQSA